MTITAFPPTASTLASRSIIVDATRCWRDARMTHAPVQPALFELLAAYRCDVLGPAIDSLLRLYERCTGRPLDAGAPGQASLSGDEQQLLDLLSRAERDAPPVGGLTASPRLLGALRAALRSAAAMLRLALDQGDRAAGMPHLRLLHA